MPYTFRQIPDVGTVEELRQWLSEELKLISESLNESIELELRASKHEPERPREGMIVHADGAAWNPGTGAGTYRYQSGAWVKITSPADLGAYLPLAGGQMTGRLELANGTVTGNSGMATGTGSLGEIEAQNNGTGAAMMAFHRSGAFAGYFGLDTDNVFKIGGWSFGANAYKVWTEQTLPVFGAAVAGYVPASGGGTANFLRADGTWTGAGAVLQVLQTTNTANTDLTTAIPFDDTVPTNTEGTSVLSQAITPASSSNKILCEVDVWGSSTLAGNQICVALFRGTTCIAAVAHSENAAAQARPVTLTFLDSPATTSATTYEVRVGPPSGTVRLNGIETARRFGGVGVSTLTLSEIRV